ncbi:MAG: hypothetical protein MZV70_53795 [Desulfobacterales bacterium]|nr:hypothetical protein [Desulfobacterales bacterium]
MTGLPPCQAASCKRPSEEQNLLIVAKEKRHALRTQARRGGAGAASVVGRGIDEHRGGDHRLFGGWRRSPVCRFVRAAQFGGSRSPRFEARQRDRSLRRHPGPAHAQFRRALACRILLREKQRMPQPRARGDRTPQGGYRAGLVQAKETESGPVADVFGNLNFNVVVSLHRMLRAPQPPRLIDLEQYAPGPTTPASSF